MISLLPKSRTAALPVEVIVEAARQLASQGEYPLAERMLRAVIARDAGNPAARRWLIFSLEAQEKYGEAHDLHILKRPGEG